MSKWERKFGKYAIPNLTVILLLCYVAGYVIELFNSSFFSYLTLNPYMILHGQIWRLVTWIIIPPSSLDFFTLIMLFFYYSIGTVLERTWGTWKYNVYIFTGMLLTIVGAFLCMGLYYLTGAAGEGLASYIGIPMTFAYGSYAFSTYYINIAIYMAYAMTYPNAVVLLMFIIPVKMKWMGIVDLVLMLLSFLTGDIFTRFAVAAALINVGLFYLNNVKRVNVSPRQIKRRSDYNRNVNRNVITKHKCAICGRTDEDSPELQFRFCSKCNGNYEYCQYHLFTHEHVK
ncbi:MAG: hypothetical protein LUG83_01415 [Lachnospiraceae bacterium]|nr:hypothetical protein [Lachnospiraceae bacterium]